MPRINGKNSGRRSPASDQRSLVLATRLKADEWRKLERVAAAEKAEKGERVSYPDVVLTGLEIADEWLSGRVDGEEGAAWVRGLFKESGAVRRGRRGTGRSRPLLVPVNAEENGLVERVASELDCDVATVLRFGVLYLYEHWDGGDWPEPDVVLDWDGTALEPA